MYDTAQTVHALDGNLYMCGEYHLFKHVAVTLHELSSIGMKSLCEQVERSITQGSS